MNIKRQLWTPDTCGCHVEEEYDADNPNSPMTCVGVRKKCPAHAAVLDADLYGVLYANPDGDNKRKNRIHGMLFGYEGPDLSLWQDVLTADGTVRQFKSGIGFSWAFSGTGANRVITVTITGKNLTANQRNLVQNYLDTTFGVGKVVLA